MTLYLNSDEPRSKALEDFAGQSVYYGVAPGSGILRRAGFYDVTLPCPKCGHPIAYRSYNLASIGEFACTHCAHRSQSVPEVQAQDVDYAQRSFRFDGETWHITYTTPFYLYNYAMAIGVCRRFGLSNAQIRQGFETFVNPAERREVLQYHGKQIHYLRMKQENPETLQSALDTIAADPAPKAVFLGMYEVKDFLPYYTNTFYFFDCDFAPVARTEVEKYVVFSTTVCYDTANRLRYDGAPEERITVLDTEDIPTILAQLDTVETDNIYFLTGMKPYRQIKRYFVQGGAENG
jgi:predicted RNA-binding Zn-ribbon protein involved in translation (DUF1610 family)